MSVAPLDTHPVVACVDAMEAALDASPPAAWSGLAPTEVRALLARLARIEARIGAQKMAAARVLDASDVAREAGATSTGDLLARDFGGDRRSGDRLVRTADRLEATGRTQEALATGDVTVAQADVIATGLGKLPGDVTDEQRELAERSLLKDAPRLNLKDLRRRTDRLTDVYAPTEKVDEHENEHLVERERRARAKSAFDTWDNNDGTWSGRFRLPEAEGVMLKTAVDALAAPRRLPEEDDGPPVDRMGAAFAELCSHLPTDGLASGGGVGAVVTVNLDLDTLLGGTKAATLTGGGRLSAGQARQLACRVGIIPMVLNGTSLPLDLGRTQRLFTRSQRLALARRDGGCTFPGCDRPPHWCEAHHLTPYSAGGQTDLAEGALLCSRHHHLVHDQDWIPRIAHDGHVEWRSSRSARWRRNHRWRADVRPGVGTDSLSP